MENGRFTLDILQLCSSPVFVNALLKELEENGSPCEKLTRSAYLNPVVELPHEQRG